MADRRQMRQICARSLLPQDTGEKSFGDYRNTSRFRHLTLDTCVLNVPREDGQLQQDHRSMGADNPLNQVAQVLSELFRRSGSEEVIAANLEEDQLRVFTKAFNLSARGSHGGTRLGEVDDLDGVLGGK
jgi:hypothetical protein